MTVHPRILVFDDDRSSRLGLERLLRTASFEVVTAGDGVEALEVLARVGADVVLTDLRMPRLDGIGLCRRIHERDEDLPVILVSAAGDISAVVDGMRAGATDFLSKPIDFDVLVALIHRAIATRVLRIERQQARAQAELLYREALDAVKLRDETLAIVAHDLRGPLSVALLQAQEMRASADVATHVKLDRIVRSCLRMDCLVRDLLADARTRLGEFPLAVGTHLASALLEDASELRPLALHKSVRLDLIVCGPSRTVRCDRARIAQVLTNLVSNAIKFTRTAILVTADTTGDELCFSVSDDGAGLTEETCARVFDRHWQQRSSRAGSLGLGLYIAKQIVDAHRGRLWIESEVGYGTMFSFTVPDGRLSSVPPPPSGSQRGLRRISDRVVTVRDGASLTDSRVHGIDGFDRIGPTQ
jgi:signal transduction histidine kinase